MATLIHHSPHQWQANVRRKGYPSVSKTVETKADAQRCARLLEQSEYPMHELIVLALTGRAWT